MMIIKLTNKKMMITYSVLVSNIRFNVIDTKGEMKIN